MMKKTWIAGLGAAAAAALMLAAPAAHAGNASFSLQIGGAPYYGYGYPGGYVYTQPSYVYAQPGYVYSQPSYGYGYRPHRRDRDHDGIPNRFDRDRDNDGVPNRFDRRPNNPRRY